LVESLSDAIHYDRSRTAVDLAEALARKGKSDEITEARLLAAVVYRWLGTNISYDVNSLNPTSRAPQDPDKVLKAKSAICEGYSCLAEFLLNHLQVETRVVHGFARTGNNAIGGKFNAADDGHAWNVVRWGGAWHIMDFTWSAGSVREGKFSPAFKWDWFDASPEVAIYSHFPENPDYQLLKIPVSVDSVQMAAHLKPLFFEAMDSTPLPLINGTLSLGGASGPLKWKTRPDFQLLAHAEPSKGTAKHVDADLFVNAAGETEMRFPGLKEGSYNLSLFTARTNQKSYSFCGSFRLILTSQTSNEVHPKVFGKYHESGLHLVEPVSGMLNAGNWQRFAVTGPRGLSLSLQYGGDTTLSHLTFHAGEYVANLLLKKGKLTLYLTENQLLLPVAEFEAR
jgi:hypothetical protein